MLYKQIKRVSELDNEITQMHELLANLYEERKELFAEVGAENSIMITPPTESSVVIAPKKQQSEAKHTYDDLAHVWRQVGASLPAYRELKTKLEVALRMRQKLQDAEPALADSAVIVAVPPYHLLKELVAKNGRGSTFSFSEHISLGTLPKTKVWSFVILASPLHSQAVTEFDDVHERELFDRSGFDMRGLNTASYIAAALQGAPLLADGAWTLLLKGASDVAALPCAMRQGNHYTIDTDDSAYLVGDNYVQLALAVAAR